MNDTKEWQIIHQTPVEKAGNFAPDLKQKNRRVIIITCITVKSIVGIIAAEIHPVEENFTRKTMLVIMIVTVSQI